MIQLVSPKELTAFRMAPEVMAALRKVRAKEGIPVAVQIDFAVRAWLRKKGVHVKRAERKRVGARRRS